METLALNNPCWLFYRLVADYKPVGCVDSNPNWQAELTPNENKSKDHKQRIKCRGVWIDLSEDADGCWLQTPYYVGVKADSFTVDRLCVHPCHTMNDVWSAANAGLLFPDEPSAITFIKKLQAENDYLNFEA